MTSIMWFRRDLRLTDHPALNAAADAGPVLPLLVLNPAQLDGAGEKPRARFLAAVRALDEQIEGRLVLRVGDPKSVLPAVAAEVNATAVFASADFTPYGKSRDAAVSATLKETQRQLNLVGSPYAVSPGRVLKGDGTPYRVFTPFYKAWLVHGWRPPAAQTYVKWQSADSESLPPSDAKLGGPVGEAAALSRFNDFMANGVTEYGTDRDRPDLAGTSWLSPALRFGEVHPRTLLARLNDEGGQAKFRAELCWREFYADVLHHTPTAVDQPIDPRFTNMRWDTGAVADQRFESWKTGRTGYPIVDAGMRQLLQTGWMHNRVRMITASFLIKHLHIDWRWGEEWFRSQLLDGDTASNSLSWQWVAGCGTDAAPFIRVFNPVLQSYKFDPLGDYIRKYVPELAGLSADEIHEPWNSPLLAPDYPAPIIDLAEERAEALGRFAEIGAR